MKRTAILVGMVFTLVPAGSAYSMSSSGFQNCTAMHKVYRHGVGRVGARDHTSGKPVTTFKRSNRLYNANKSLDRDKDGIACEKK
jgi:hypothetical protein